jgi:hypothetical protein
MVVEYHLHSSSDAQEVMSSTASVSLSLFQRQQEKFASVGMMK